MPIPVSRRTFLLSGTATTLAFLMPQRLLAIPATTERKFYAILSLGRIGFHASFPDAMELASKYGFEGLDPDADYLASLNDDALHRLLDDLQKRNLKFGAAGLPVEFRKDDETFHSDLKKLSATAAI